jgi:hypothetical protein
MIGYEGVLLQGGGGGGGALRVGGSTICLSKVALHMGGQTLPA